MSHFVASSNSCMSHNTPILALTTKIWALIKGRFHLLFISYEMNSSYYLTLYFELLFFEPLYFELLYNYVLLNLLIIIYYY